MIDKCLLFEWCAILMIVSEQIALTEQSQFRPAFGLNLSAFEVEVGVLFIILCFDPLLGVLVVLWLVVLCV